MLQCIADLPYTRGLAGWVLSLYYRDLLTPENGILNPLSHPVHLRVELRRYERSPPGDVEGIDGRFFQSATGILYVFHITRETTNERLLNGIIKTVVLHDKNDRRPIKRVALVFGCPVNRITAEQAVIPNQDVSEIIGIGSIANAVLKVGEEQDGQRSIRLFRYNEDLTLQLGFGSIMSLPTYRIDHDGV